MSMHNGFGITYEDRYSRPLGAPSQGSNFTCISPTIHWHGITVYVPLQIPVTIMCIIIGWGGFAYLKKQQELKGNKGYVVYSIMMFFFGCMNFSGLFANSFFPSGWVVGHPGSFAAIFFALADTYFTSVVNMSFIFCGLVDIGILNDKSRLFRWLYSLGMFAIAVGYHLTLNGKWKNGFNWLYLDLCEIGFFAFVACGLVFLATHRRVLCKGLGPLVGAVANGLMGISTLHHADWVCKRFGLWVGPDMVWFFFSGLALFCLFLYFLQTTDARKPSPLLSVDGVKQGSGQIVLVCVTNDQPLTPPDYSQVATSQEATTPPNFVYPQPTTEGKQ